MLIGSVKKTIRGLINALRTVRTIVAIKAPTKVASTPGSKKAVMPIESAESIQVVNDIMY